MSLPSPYYQDSAVTIYYGDCRQILPFLGKFDLLLTDPPYGIGVDKSAHKSSGHVAGHGYRRVARRTYEQSNWDSGTLDEWVFLLARNLCNKQIIFGGNYYSLPPSRCWLVWDKENDGNDFADCELAWTNINGSVRMKRHLWNGMARKGREPREHPTQKPTELMSWAIHLAGEVKTILDPCAGAGTTGRAAKDLGKKATLIEREERYCEIAARRMSQEVLAL
jgi:site-specific DNA-methyltransferase (adenine-specific)/modification methylase